MGDYFSQADAETRMRDHLTELYELPEEQTDLDADIDNVETTVNSYVGKRYAVPITSDTAIAFLKVLCLDLFEETAWHRGSGDELPKKVQTKADNARKQLELVSKGTITLGGATALTERQTGGADAIIVDGNTPEFDRDNMKGF